jgi:hypothetical protein
MATEDETKATYVADCIAGASYITSVIRTEDGKFAEVKVIDNTEGTGAYDDIDLQPGTTNFDNGGCALDINTQYLLDKYHVVNHVYDKFKRSAEHNTKVLLLVKEGQFDTSTSNSILNVIACPMQRAEHIRLSHTALKPGGTAYFKVWSGLNRGSDLGTGRLVGSSINASGDFQSNCPARYYLPEIQKIFCTSRAETVNATVIDELNLIKVVKAK